MISNQGSIEVTIARLDRYENPKAPIRLFGIHNIPTREGYEDQKVPVPFKFWGKTKDRLAAALDKGTIAKGDRLLIEYRLGSEKSQDGKDQVTFIANAFYLTHRSKANSGNGHQSTQRVVQRTEPSYQDDWDNYLTEDQVSQKQERPLAVVNDPLELGDIPF